MIAAGRPSGFRPYRKRGEQNMPLPDQTALLCRAIMEKGRADSRNILVRAEAEAGRIVSRAREESSRETEEELARRRRHARREAGRIVDSAGLKAKQRIMAARQEILAELFREGRSRLLALRHTRQYEKILRDLARRAVQALPPGECRLQLRREDMELFAEPQLQDLSALTGRRVLLADEPAAISGGCLALGREGRVLVDFSFDTLLERNRSLLQDILSREIPGER
ncbi:MAG TPA: hypothetical protein ENI89_00245 [Desulfobulbus sp.]|nr:hypothetical protein [Desulfobulbus sp.]